MSNDFSSLALTCDIKERPWWMTTAAEHAAEDAKDAAKCAAFSASLAAHYMKEAQKAVNKQGEQA